MSFLAVLKATHQCRYCRRNSSTVYGLFDYFVNDNTYSQAAIEGRELIPDLCQKAAALIEPRPYTVLS